MTVIVHARKTRKNGGKETAKIIKASAVQKEGKRTSQPTHATPIPPHQATSPGWAFVRSDGAARSTERQRMSIAQCPYYYASAGMFRLNTRAWQRKGKLKAPLPGSVCLALPHLSDVTAWPLFQALLVMIQCLKAKVTNCDHGPNGPRACSRQEFGPEFK